MRSKLKSVKTEMRRRMHLPIPEQGRWLARVLQGHYNYYAVPDNSEAMRAFRRRVIRHWRAALKRRSQKGRTTWERIDRSPPDGYPNPASCTPGPTSASTPKPKGGAQCVDAHAGICAGGRRQRRSLPRSWEHVGPWIEHRIQLPIGPLFCILAGPTRGRGWSATAARGRASPTRRPGRGPPAVRAAPAPTRSRDRDGPRRDPAAGHPATARTRAPRNHLDLSPGNRYTRDCRHGPPPAATRDPSERWSAAITRHTQGGT